jgi:hypothetical protein
MKYETPTIEVAGDAQKLVLGTKNRSNIPDAPPSTLVHSTLAYEADE